MTPYQQFENELLALGWNKEQGSGDHIKFYKEGNPRTVVLSRTMKGNGSTYDNALAEIRRAEPRFPIGRPSGWKPKEDRTDEENSDEDMPEWMRPGSTVRLTAPESKDYSKLSDPTSVMNQRYTVLEYSPEAVTIQDEKKEHPPFVVSAGGLDPWKTEPCANCGRTLPYTLMGKAADGRTLCPKCIAEAIKNEKRKSALKMTASTAAADGKQLLLDELDEIFRPLRDVNLNELPEDVLSDMKRKIRETLNTLPADKLRKMRKLNPALFESIEDAPSVKTPYQTWRELLNRICEWIIIRDRLSKRKDKDELVSRIFKTSYSLTKLKGRDGQDDMNLLEVGAKDFFSAYAVWQWHDRILSEFITPAGGDTPTAMLLSCPSENVRQYLTQNGVDLAKLKALLPGEDPDAFRREEADTAFPAGEVSSAVREYIRELAGSDKEGMRIYMARSLHDDHADDFETATPFMDVRICFDDINRSHEEYNILFSKLADGLEENPARFPGDAVITLKKLSQSTAKTGTVVEFPFIHPRKAAEPAPPQGNVSAESEVFGTGPGQTLFKIVMHEPREGVFTVCGPDYKDQEQYDTFQDALHSVFYSLSRQQKNEPRHVHEALQDIIDDAIEKAKPQNNTTMNTDNILDRTNPGSGNPAAGALTTREMLRELKDRGVSFTGLDITVRTVIDIDSI